MQITFKKKNRIRLRVVKGLVYQAPVLQFILIIVMNVVDHADFLEKKVRFTLIFIYFHLTSFKML